MRGWPAISASFRKRARSRSGPPSGSQGGFAYLMALFMMVALIIASQVAVRNVLIEGRREREDETIWRGQQYVHAIRLYYRKTGHYPSTLDDLKKGMPELHFLRYAAYKDPMKKDDGAWRFIYVNGAGQIIGSVKYATLQQMAIMDMNGGKIPDMKPGTSNDQPGVPVSTLADQSNANASNQAPQNPLAASGAGGGLTPGAGQGPDNSTNPANAPQNPLSAQPAQTSQGPQATLPNPTNAIGTPLSPGGTNTNMNNQSLAALAALKPTGPVDGPVLGGFLSGVASSVDKPSIRVYKGAKKYIGWEFIWNPVEDQAKAVQQGLNPQGALPGQPGQAIGGGPAGTNSGPGLNFGGPGSPNAATQPTSPTQPTPNPVSPGPTPQ
jgi:hypothetical protein